MRYKMEQKIMFKKVVNWEENEKFFLKHWVEIWYNYGNPRKQKAFTPYSETEKSLGSNVFTLFFRGKGGVKRRMFICRI